MLVHTNQRGKVGLESGKVLSRSTVGSMKHKCTYNTIKMELHGPPDGHCDTRHYGVTKRRVVFLFFVGDSSESFDDVIGSTIRSSTRTRLSGDDWGVGRAGIVSMTAGCVRLISWGRSMKGKSMAGVKTGVSVINFGFWRTEVKESVNGGDKEMEPRDCLNVLQCSASCRPRQSTLEASRGCSSRRFVSPPCFLRQFV